jgi:type II secretory ATPase GspE/PulE/Tfp pilus assembly ATPase PilB-like protein
VNDRAVEFRQAREEIKEIGLDPSKITSRQIFRPGTAQCPHCQGSGYAGRLGIHEILVIDDEVRGQIIGRLDSNTIKTSAMKRGFSTLRMDGGRKVLQGVTSVEEVILATHDVFVELS